MKCINFWMYVKCMYAFKLKFTLMKWIEDEMLVFYFGTASWCIDKSNNRTMMFCYNISLRYNSSRHFYVLTVCDPEIFVVDVN